MGYSKSLFKLPVTIPTDTAVSNVIHCNDGVPVAIRMPAGWTAAALTFRGAEPNDDNSDTTPATLYDVYDSSGEVSISSPAASQIIMLSPSSLAGLGFIQIRSGTGSAPVNQAAERELVLLFRNLE